MDLRVQNNRDQFYIHVADHHYHLVKDEKYHVLYYPASIVLAPGSGARFIPRYGRVGNKTPHCPGYENALRVKYANPYVPLFGPLGVLGTFGSRGEISFGLPSPANLPWPTEMAFKYSFDQEASVKLVRDRVADLQRLGKDVLEIPAYMSEYLGEELLNVFRGENPWLRISLR